METIDKKLFDALAEECRYLRASVDEAQEIIQWVADIPYVSVNNKNIIEKAKEWIG